MSSVDGLMNPTLDSLAFLELAERFADPDGSAKSFHLLFRASKPYYSLSMNAFENPPTGLTFCR